MYATDGTVIGMNTAAEVSQQTGTTIAGYAIPIDHALSIAARIVGGEVSSTIHQGLPAFLGVTIAAQASTGQGVAVSGVVPGSAAAQAGITAGDTVTALGGTSASTAAQLRAAVSSHHPGDRVSVTWTDSSGVSHTATVTLGTGPAD